MSAFSGISDSEYQELKHAISYITILVAGADDHIDEEEKKWAEKLTNIRSYASDETLQSFYDDVGANFSDILHNLIEELPDNAKERNVILGDRLSKLNDILPKLDNKIGATLYESYTSFAKHVAKASGGFLRFFSISGVEKEVVDLPMVNEIVFEEE